MSGNDGVEILGVQARRELRRTDEVAEHDGQAPTFGSGRRRPGGRRVSRGRRRAERADRAQQPFALAERQADLFQVVLDEVRQDVEVDLMRRKYPGAAPEAESIQPVLQRVAHRPRGAPRQLICGPLRGQVSEPSPPRAARAAWPYSVDTTLGGSPKREALWIERRSSALQRRAPNPVAHSRRLWLCHCNIATGHSLWKLLTCRRG